MWPFSDDTEESVAAEVDPSLDDFHSVAQEIVKQAPDVESGLAALQDIYKEYQFSDSSAAMDAFVQYSDSARKRFGDTKTFDQETTYELAPVNFVDIQAEGDTPEDRQLDSINKWERQNLEELSQTDNLSYLQSRSQLERGIRSAAAMQRREIYGKDRYISDAGLRFAEGAVTPITDALGVDSVRDWFTENKNPNNDETYWAAVSSGLGFAAGASGLTTLTGGAGGLAYVGTAGVGAVRRTVETAIENEASTPDAIAAGALETVSQVGQALVGGKLVSGLAGRLSGQATEQLGMRLVTRAAAQGAEMAAISVPGHALSVTAQNIATGEDTPITQGMGQAVVGGFVTGGVIGALGGHGKPREKTPEATGGEKGAVPESVLSAFPDMVEVDGYIPLNQFSEAEKSALQTAGLVSDRTTATGEKFRGVAVESLWEKRDAAKQAAPADPVEELKAAVIAEQGETPPPDEALEAPRRSIPPDGTPPVTAMKTDAGAEIVLTEDGQPHLKVGDKVLEPHDAAFHVDPVTADSLREITAGGASTPDGKAITLKAERRWKLNKANSPEWELVVESDHVAYDPQTKKFTITEKPTGKKQVEVPITAEGGSVVMANQTRLVDGVRQNKFTIAPGTVDSTAGAMSLDRAREDLGYKTGKYAQYLIKKFGNEEAERRGLVVQTEDGVRSLWDYLPLSNKEGADVAEKYIAEKGGITPVLAELQKRENYSEHDKYVADRLEAKVADALIKAEEAGDEVSVGKLKELHTDVLGVKEQILRTGARIIQTESNRDAKANAQARVIKIRQALREEAATEIQRELGEDVTHTQLAKEVEKASAEVKLAEKEVNDPVEQQIAEYERQHEEEGRKEVQKYDDAIKEHQNIIQKAKEEEAAAASKHGKATETDNVRTSAVIEKLKSELETKRKEAADIQNTREEPTETQLKEEKHQQTTVDRLTKMKEELQAEKESLHAEKPVAGKPHIQSAKEKLEQADQLVKSVEKKLDDLKGQKSNQIVKAEKTKLQEQLSKAKQERVKAKSEHTAAVNKDAELAKKIATKEEQINRASEKLEGIRADIKERTSKPKDAASVLQQAAALEKHLKALAEAKSAADSARKPTKKVPAVERARKRAADSMKAIRKLEKEKKALQPTKKQLKILKDKDALIQANKEGRVAIDPAKRARLVQARTAEEKARARYNRAQTILKEKLSKFSTDDRTNLEGFYQIREQLPPGESRRQVDSAIFAIESKYLKDGDNAAVSALFNFWRGNLLTGISTQIRNVGGNLWKAGTNVAATAVTGLPRGSLDVFAYTGGWLKGFSDARTEALEVIKGNRRGRTKLDIKGEELLPAPKLDNPLTAVQNIAFRLMSAGDVFFYRAAESGQAHLLEYNAAEKAGVPAANRREWVQDKMYNTTKKREQIKADVAAQAALLEKAGIKMTPEQRTIAEYERAELLRDETSRTSRKISEYHALRSVFQQEPEGFLGAMYRGLNAAMRDESGHITIAGKKINALEYAFPFMKIATNMSNMLLDHTPIGALRAYEMRGDPLKALEARQVLGQAVVGSALMGAFFSIAYAHKDDKDPFVEFYGDYPQGKYNEWLQKGIQPFSMRVGGTTIPLQNTPLAIIPAVIGGAMSNIKAGASPLKVAGVAAIAPITVVATQSFLKPAGDILRFLSGGGESGGKNVENQIYSQIDNFGSGFIPNIGLLNNIGKWMESSPTDTYNNLSAKLFGQMPFAREMGIGRPMLNYFGEPLEQPFLQRAGAGVLPITAHKTDPALLFLIESGYSITDQGPTFRLSPTEQRLYGARQKAATGYQDIMDEEQSYEVLKKSGPRIKQLVMSVRNDPAFSVATDRNQKWLNEQVAKIRARAKAEVLGGL